MANESGDFLVFLGYILVVNGLKLFEIVENWYLMLRNGFQYYFDIFGNFQFLNKHGTSGPLFIAEVLQKIQERTKPIYLEYYSYKSGNLTY